MGGSQSEAFAELEARVAQCMLADRHRFARRLGALRGRAADDAARERLAIDIERSRERLERRRRLLPAPTFPPELPVSAARERIARTIAAHQVCIVCGETGSGKTTQIPKICLELGRGAAALIGHTQPRRIAARSVAARIAHELGTELGTAVGYQVRFTGGVGPDTYVKLMTDGILLAEIRRDRHLAAYDTLIIDEAHERSLNIDFLLGYLKRLLPQRPDLKLIITSASIDTERYAAHFDDAPVVEVSGRGWPVEVRYRPLGESGEDDRDLNAALVDAAEEALRSVSGDVLVFLPGEREIREAVQALRKRALEAELLPLYARLPAAQQQRVFTPHSERRIVLATNVAETSLTVPGIHCVIDSGLVRISRYSYRSKIQRLPVEKISRASAEQRKGRCGRLAPGVCIRLYAEDDARERPEFTPPEIVRTNLAAVILQMKAMGLGEPVDFPFLDAPDQRFVADGYRLLRELAALTDAGRLTPLGRRLARMPLDPRIGRMVLAAADEGCLAEVAIIAAALSIPDPRERPRERREEAERSHAPLRDERSDFVSLLNLWQFFHAQAAVLSNSALRRLCRERHLSWARMREWQEVHGQLQQMVREFGLRPNRRAATYARIHRALLSGLLGHIGLRTDEREFTGARSARFRLSPGSTLHGSGVKWVVAAELIETRHCYAHTVAHIRPEWIEQAGRHLVKRSYFDPYWDAGRAEVWARERVTLYGLTLVAGRRVPYTRIDRETARHIFIQSALVEGRYRTEAAFLRHNQAQIAAVRALEHKLRRPDLLVDEDAIHGFYARRIPHEIASGAAFETWRREAERRQPQLLCMERDFLLTDADAADRAVAAFPDAFEVNGQQLPLAYRFDPADEADGVSVTVPVALLNQLEPAPFEWLVPGMLREKLIALLRSLPKNLRRHFVPLPEYADACLSAFTRTDAMASRPLITALEEAIQRHSGLEVPVGCWRPQRLPRYLYMRFVVVDGAGVERASGRDLVVLQRRFGGEAARSFATLPAAGFERSGLTRWSFGELPHSVDVAAGGLRYAGHPALVDEAASVSLRLLDTPERAAQETRHGLRRLFKLQIPRELKRLRDNLPGLSQLCLGYALVAVPPAAVEGTRGGARADACAELRRDLIDAIIDRAFLGEDCEVRSASAFEDRMAEGVPRLVRIAGDLCTLVGRILERHRHVLSLRRDGFVAAHPESFADIDVQLAHLVYRGFVVETPRRQLTELPRYLEALALRVRKLTRDPARDTAHALDLRALWERYLARRRDHLHRGIRDPELVRYRWLLEELRVSLFAQELGTAEPISHKRLARQWARVKV